MRLSFYKSLLQGVCFNPRTHTACDRLHIPNLDFHLCFNPRTHTACDLIDLNHFVVYIVSIHARTRRATILGLVIYEFKKFQSTHAHGVRHSKLIIFMEALLFQSTHAHGVRLKAPPATELDSMFQSTHAHGVRLCSR